MFFYLLPLILGCLVSGFVLLLTVVFTSPETRNGSLITINLVYFFLSSWVFLACILTLLLYSVRSFRFRKRGTAEVMLVNKPKLWLRISLRQGVLITTALVGIGLLNALKFSNPLNIILLVSATTLIEVYFFSH